MNLLFWKKKPAPAPATPLTVQLTDPLWPRKLEAFKERLAWLPAEDDLLVGLMGKLDRCVLEELERVANPDLDSRQADLTRGRIGMLLDFKGDLQSLWNQSVQERQAKVQPRS